MFTSLDAPTCPKCGSIMIPNANCHKCVNCGMTSGCSSVVDDSPPAPDTALSHNFVGVDLGVPGSQRVALQIIGVPGMPEDMMIFLDDEAIKRSFDDLEWSMALWSERQRWRVAWERDRTGVAATNALGGAP